MLTLNWHQYKYYPYEQQLAIREIESLVAPQSVHFQEAGVSVNRPKRPALANRLVYFASSGLKGDLPGALTQQAMLERVNGNGRNRQSTRYSAHGLHEYKGKFNPQIAKALLNIFGVNRGDWALDPFCGSGTSLVEAVHLGVNAVGTDINPLAVFLANAKISALSIPAASFLDHAEGIARRTAMRRSATKSEDARAQYLKSWFSPDIFSQIESLRQEITELDATSQPVLLALASNLLRDYSLQEPSDLRIRRRTSPMPTMSLLEAFSAAVCVFAKRLVDSQSILGLLEPTAKARLLDCRQSLAEATHSNGSGFDVALTSPPYATALPYIDTQRLSLVWLGLIPASEILTLEARLIGSREMRGQGKRELQELLLLNAAKLPIPEASLCLKLNDALTSGDGFRRQAVPRLLYRYFSGMADSFAAVHAVMKPGAKYGLIVGGNHTVLGGKRFDIHTSDHLTSLAVSRGWTHMETVELQTYKRYGLHAKNAGTTEALIVLQA